MSIVIKTFQTPNGNYIFDRETNSIINVNNSEFLSFKNIEAGTADCNDLSLIKKYQSKGFCGLSNLTTIEHPEYQHLEYLLNNKIEMITLQITQNCNLRCKYCTYSGNYNNQRTHTNKTMSMEIIKKSIDFGMEHSKETKQFNIGFYGGEPLLEIDKIMECINYIKSEYKDKNVRYSMTTNGTLFSEKALKLLMDNDFNVLISFDGPKDIHDKNRVYANGKGSFDDIMNNIKRIKECYPDFFKKIRFNTVIAPGNDFKCVNDFFEASDVIEDDAVQKANVNIYNAASDIAYDDLYFKTNNFQNLKILLVELGYYSKDKTSKLYKSDFISVKRFYKRLGKMKGLYEISHPGGPCLAGVSRPFVDINGNLYPCERVSEGSEVMKIGSIYTGFDKNKIDDLVNIGKITQNECKFCWNFVGCTLCAAAADENSKLSRTMRLSHCNLSMGNTMYYLKTICMLLENGYDFEMESEYE